jgi:carbamoyl-phosphate synthase large subunit
MSVNDHDKAQAVKIARDFREMGFELMATKGTAAQLRAAGLPVAVVNKVSEGSYHVVDAIRSGRVALVVNTPLGPGAYTDGRLIRQAATQCGVPLVTTLSAAAATVQAIRELRKNPLEVASLQELHGSRGQA